MALQGEDAPQQLLQPRLQSLVVPEVPKQQAEAGLHARANSLRLCEHRGGLSPAACHGPELRKASGSQRGLRTEQTPRCFLRLGKRGCSPGCRDRYCTRGSFAHHSVETSGGQRRTGRARPRTARPEAASPARAPLPQPRSRPGPPLLRAGAEQPLAEQARPGQARAGRLRRRGGSPAPPPALPAAVASPARQREPAPAAPAAPPIGCRAGPSGRGGGASGHGHPRGFVIAERRRGARRRPAARPGVMAAAPGPLQPGGHAAEIGADPAASEVASSALRCLAGLAGQVSAGRAEREAWGRAGPGAAGPAPHRALPGPPWGAEQGVLLLLPGLRGPSRLQGLRYGAGEKRRRPPPAGERPRFGRLLRPARRSRDAPVRAGAWGRRLRPSRRGQPQGARPAAASHGRGRAFGSSWRDVSCHSVV